MNIKEMTAEALEERVKAIDAECETEGADTEALKNEMRAICAELEERKKAADEKRKKLDQIAEKPISNPVNKEEKNMEEKEKEIRNSKAYIEAFAEGIKKEDMSECRALLTENGSGQVPVPDFVYDVVKTAWEREGIMRRVRTTYLRGNLPVSFEISGDDATVHTEGAAAIDPENLVLGIVKLVPVSIKKAVQVSDEVMDMRGEAFLRYIYDELTYKIAKKMADRLIDKINACGTVSTNTPTTNVAVSIVEEASISVGTIDKALAELSDQAANPTIIMNKKTWGLFKAAQKAASYAADPFEGYDVIFNNHIPAFSAATTGVAYCIVGDLDYGAHANFPNGEEITFKFDDLTLKKQDLVEILGRKYGEVGVVAPYAFVRIMKEASA